MALGWLLWHKEVTSVLIGASKPQQILDNATSDANNIRMGALSYTDEMLANLEKIMSHTIDSAGTKYNNFINSSQSCYDIVNKNRSLPFGNQPAKDTGQHRRRGRQNHVKCAQAKAFQERGHPEAQLIEHPHDSAFPCQ